MMKHSSLEPLVESNLPTKYGKFQLNAYPSEVDQFPHLALFTKDIFDQEVVNVRIHSECMTGDVFGSSKCDCGEQLESSMKWTQNTGGIILYLRQEGRGIGLVNKLKAYNLQDVGLNTKEANLELGFHPDSRNYGIALQILENLKVSKIQLMTNNPEKIEAFQNSNIEIVARLPIEIEPGVENLQYLKTKKDEMGHLLSNY